jgi:polyisoprenoid-binding protein YceI
MTPPCGDDVGVRDTTELEGRTPSRSRRALAILAILAVVAVGAVAAAYLVFFTDDAPAPLALSEQPATTAPATSAAAGGATDTTTPAGAGTDLVGTWRAAAGSEAGYRVREKLADLPAQSDAVGRTTGVTGTVKVDRSGSSLVATEANVEVDLTRLTSNESRRDNRIRTDGLQTSRFPRATFVSTRPIPLPPETASGQAVKATAEGDLTLHGVTKRVTIPIDVRVTGNKGELVGSLSFPMSDFNISPPNVAGFVTVDSNATMEFKLVLEKA